MSQEIIAVLDKIAQYLGTTSEKVLEILTRMAFADAVVASMHILISIVLLVIVYIASHRTVKMLYRNERLDDEAIALLIGVTIIIGAIFIILLVLATYLDLTRLSGFFSPELWAYYELLPKLMK